MKKTAIFLRVVVFILIIILLVAMALLTKPILRSEEGIRRHLLRMTPLGTSMEDVIRVANDNSDWSIRSVREDVGVTLNPRSTRPVRGIENDPRYLTIGEQSIYVYLGKYQIIMRVDVTAFYAFDKSGGLIEILVLKEFDLV